MCLGGEDGASGRKRSRLRIGAVMPAVWSNISIIKYRRRNPTIVYLVRFLFLCPLLINSQGRRWSKGELTVMSLISAVFLKLILPTAKVCPD